MKKLLLILIMGSSLYVNAAEAPKLLVNYLFENLRIVLATELECNVPDMKGHRASAQRLDGLYVPGCWYVMKDHPHMIHIDWANGDFSELPAADFQPADLTQ